VRVRYIATLSAWQCACLVLPGFSTPTSGQQWTGERALVIGGAADDRDSHSFLHVRGLLILEGGRIAVADAQANNVRVFDRLGALIASAGRAGEGPGDLKSPCCLAMDGEGSLWVFEDGNSRYSSFKASSGRLTFDTSVRVPSSVPNHSSTSVVWSPAGHFLAFGTIRGGGPLERRYVRSELGRNGAIVGADTSEKFQQIEGRAKELRKAGRNGRPGASSLASPPFASGALVAVGPKGETATASSGKYRVEWKDAGGRVKAVLSQAGNGPAVTKAEVDAIRSNFAKLSEEYRTTVSFPIPKFKPVLSGLAFDQDGRLWVMRSVVKGAPAESDLYDRDGRLLARVRWPQGVATGVFAASGRQAAALSADANGVWAVVRIDFR